MSISTSKERFPTLSDFVTSTFFQGMNLLPIEQQRTLYDLVENFAGNRMARQIIKTLANELAMFAIPARSEDKMIQELWDLGASDIPTRMPVMDVISELEKHARQIERDWKVWKCQQLREVERLQATEHVGWIN